jgi:uncharacterized membrane protein
LPCEAKLLGNIPLFSLLDDEETAVLASQVELRTFAMHERIYKIGDAAGPAWVVIAGKVRVSMVDEDQQDVVVDEPGGGEFFGFAAMLGQVPHQTSAVALEETACVEIARDDIAVLLERKPMAGMDLLTTLGHQLHAAQNLVRLRASRNPNTVVEQEATFGERIADHVARFGGSWAFINSFAIILIVYTVVNILLERKAWDPYPFILLNLFLSMLAAIQAPVIMMSQNRQDTRDRLRAELDFEVNCRAESEIQSLSRKLSLLDEKMDDVNDLLRKTGTRA